MAYPVEARKVYDFSIHPAQVLPGDYTAVTINAILDAETARQTHDIDAIHASVYPYLPVGTPDDPNSYDYVKVRLNNGTSTILGIPWIIQSTIQERESVKIYILLEDATMSSVEQARSALVMNGFNQIKIGTSLSAITS